MSKGLSGRVLLLDSGFLIPSSQIMAFNSIVEPSGKYCSDLGIKNRYSIPAYLQGNEQTEAVNKIIVNGLKKRLDDAKGKWVEELPHALLDVSNNASTVKKRDSFFNDV